MGQTIGSVFKGQTVMLQQNPEVTKPTVYKYYFITHESLIYAVTSKPPDLCKSEEYEHKTEDPRSKAEYRLLHEARK